MAESTQGSEFSEEQMLTLSIDRALRIWYKITGRETFRGIEWNCLSAELLNSHHCLFATNESEQLAAGMPNCKQAVDSAVRRTPQSVLHAVYKSLLDTRTCGGAIDHVSVAGEIQKEVMQQTQPTAPMSATHTPANEQSWPSRSQLAAAVPDKGLHVGKDATIKSPHLQKGEAPQLDLAEDKKLSRLESSRVDSNQQTTEKDQRQTSNVVTEASTHQAPELSSATHVPAAVPGGASHSQFASADTERDKGLRAAQAHAKAATTESPLQQAGKSPQLDRPNDKRPAGPVSNGVEVSERHTKQTSVAAAEAYTHQPPDHPSNLFSSHQPMPEDEVRARGEDRDLKSAELQRSTSRAVAMKPLEEWKDVTNFIRKYFEAKTKDVLRALLSELGITDFNILRNGSRQDLFVAVQAEVQRHRMTWFHFAQYLLRSKKTRSIVFQIAEYTDVPIRDDFKRVLKKHLGKNWCQLATQMGLARTPVDQIQEMTDATLESKIATFLDDYPFPGFRTNTETAQFLLEALQRASLTANLEDVRRDLELVVDIQGGLQSLYVPKQDGLQGVIHVLGDSHTVVSGDHEFSVPQEEYEENEQETPERAQPQQRMPPRSQTSLPTAALKATGEAHKQDHGLISAIDGDTSLKAADAPTSQVIGQADKQDNGSMSVSEGGATLEAAGAPSSQRVTADPPGTSHEFERRKEKKAAISVTRNDDAYAVFDVLDALRSEDDCLDAISSAGYSELILVREDDGKRLVHFAAERGYMNVLNGLFLAGHDVTAKMKNGETPFTLACEAGHESTIRFLLTCDHSLVSTKDALGRSCLHYPAILRNQDLTSDLIWTWSAEMDVSTKTGITPLSVGSVMGDLHIVQILVQAMTFKLSRSGKPCKKSRLPPLHAAAFAGHQHVIDFLLKCKFNKDTDHESLLELLDPDLRSEHSYTALHIAASKGHLEIVQMLVEKYECTVDAAAEGRTTPLLLAAASGHEDIVEYLLDHDADIDSLREVRTGTFHLTPLGEAALGKHVDVARLLLDRNADFRFTAGGTTSILAFACIGGSQELVQLLLSKLDSDIAQAFERKELHDIFEMPFVVSMDFSDFKCAKQLVEYMSGYIGSIDDIILAFTGKVQPHMIDLLRQYKETIAFIPDTELPNQGDTCRRVAGSRSSPMYHLCYDDGPHWATEPMQLCFMFRNLSKESEQFHTTYEDVYMEASKCILQTLMHQGYTNEDLAGAANDRGSPEAVQFFLQYHENQDRQLFLELIHSGNPSAMGVCCELVSAQDLQDVYTTDLAGLVAQQYFMEMSKRELKHPGQFGMKFSSHGGTGTGIRLKPNCQGAPNCRRPLPTVSHSTPVQKNQARTTRFPNTPSNTPSARPQLWASDKLPTPSTGPVDDNPPMPQVAASDEMPTPKAKEPLEAKPSMLDAADSENAQYIHKPPSMAVNQSPLIATKDPSMPQNSYVNTEPDLQLPKMCSQSSDSSDSFIMLPDTFSSYCDRLKMQCSPFTSQSSTSTPHHLGTSLSHLSRIEGSLRSDQQQHVPDVRTALVYSHSATADPGGVHSGSQAEDPTAPFTPSLKLHQQSQSQNAGVTQRSDESIGPENTSKSVLSHVEAQTGVGVQLQASQGSHSQDQSGTVQNPLREVEKTLPAELAQKSAVPTTPELSQHQKAFPGNAEKSLHVTAPELNQHSDVAANSEPVTDVKGRSDPCPLLPQASASPQHLLQQTNSSLSVSLPPSSGPVRSNTTPHRLLQQPNASVSFALQPSSGPVHSSATPEVPKVSRPDTIGGDLQDNLPAPVNAPSNSGIDEGLPDSESEERDSVATRLLTQPSPSNSTQFMHLQNSSQSFAPATSDKTHHLPSIIPAKEHSLLSNPASHPNQKSAPIEDTSQEETSDDDDDARSDLTYQSSTTSGSTTRNPTAEDSRNSSLSQALHPPIAGMQPRTSSLLTVTPALGTAGSGKMTSFADMHAPVGPQSNATGDEQSQTSVQSVETSVISREQQLSNLASHPTQQSAPNGDSFDGETSYGDDARVMYQSSASASATHTRASLREPPLSAPTHPPAHRSQPPTTLTNRSVNASSHMEQAKVRLPPSEVPSMIDKSAETYPSAATVVEAAHEADASAVPAYSSVEQPVVVSSGEGCPPVLSRLENVYRQDSGYLGSHHFVSSNILHRHPDSMEPSDRMPMDSYQREQDSQEFVQHSEPLLGLAKMNSEDGGRMREDEMLAYVSRQVGQKWSMLARYAGLEEDEIQQIKQSAQDRPRATMKKILERLTWNELLDVVQKHMRMLNTAAKLQHFLGRPVDALPDLVHNEIDPQQYSRTLLVASQCVSEHWKELAQYLGIDPHQHWDVLEESSDADEKCHGVLLLWLSDRRATLQELLEAVESTSAAAGSLQQLIERARLDGQH